MAGTDPTVLVVDDDAELLDLYARYLRDDFDVETAATGGEAMAAIGPECRVVLLDRRLPDVPGSEVLADIRELDVDVRVAMVTAVEPGFDIIEMEFDDYLVKPVDRQRLTRTVEHLLTRVEYSRLLDEYYRAANKIAALEAAKSREALAESDRFVALQERANALQAEVTDTLVELDDYAGAFHEVERILSPPSSSDPSRPSPRLGRRSVPRVVDGVQEAARSPITAWFVRIDRERSPVSDGLRLPVLARRRVPHSPTPPEFSPFRQFESHPAPSGSFGSVRRRATNQRFYVGRRSTSSGLFSGPRCRTSRTWPARRTCSRSP